MFYSPESLKKGGRFYLCWLADAWPRIFKTLSQKELLSCDIRKISDDLFKIVTTESGLPTNRFSLRLTSQLTFGLLRIYNKLTSMLLRDLCMIYAKFLKKSNKKWNIQKDVLPTSSKTRQQLQPPTIVEDAQEYERDIEALIQDQGNVLRNVQNITIREPTIPEYQLPQNDGFGEQQPLQHLVEPIEHMLAAGENSMRQSALGIALDFSDKSHERTHLAVHDTMHMERISEHDGLLLRKSTKDEVVPDDIIKDITRTPEMRLPQQGTLISPVREAFAERQQASIEMTEKASDSDVVRASMRREPEIELEDLENLEISPKRRRNKKIIVDKVTKISSNVLRKRIACVSVNLRCEPKRSRPFGWVAMSSTQRNIEIPTIAAENDAQEISAIDKLTDQEQNVNVTTLLEAAGLADMEKERAPQTSEFVTQRKTALRQASDSSETPLGSLDRTQVCLGDSDNSTDSQKFIRTEWGTEGTLLQIIRCIKAGIGPLTVKKLVANGPTIPNCKRFIAARCFSSLLKLKEHGFINVSKNPDTLEITDVTLGAILMNRDL